MAGDGQIRRPAPQGARTAAVRRTADAFGPLAGRGPTL